jgi:hypothetical protein
MSSWQQAESVPHGIAQVSQDAHMLPVPNDDIGLVGHVIRTVTMSEEVQIGQNQGAPHGVAMTPEKARMFRYIDFLETQLGETREEARAALQRQLHDFQATANE